MGNTFSGPVLLTISIEFSGGQEKYYGERIEQKVIRNYIQPERNRKIGKAALGWKLYRADKIAD